MAKVILPKLFGAYLLLAIISTTTLPVYAASSQNPEGVFAKICGSGQLVFIPLKGQDTPDPSQPHMTACHAICANEELDIDEDS